MKNFLVHICLLSALMMCGVNASSQDKNYIKGLKGIDSLSVSRVWLASMVVPGYGQAYNNDYWKIPVIYAGAGTLAYMGFDFNSKKHEAKQNYWKQLALGNYDLANEFDRKSRQYRHNRDLAYVGAAVFYLGGALDAVYSYKTTKDIVPEKPTIYSTLIPGLGQAYNNEHWKIPIIYGGLGFCGYLINFNNIQYNRYRDAFNNASLDLPHEFPKYTKDNLKYLRDEYRRNRDYSILAFGVVYLLNIVDSYVFAQLADYDISDNLSMKFEPTLFNHTNFASTFTPTVGFNLTITLK